MRKITIAIDGYSSCGKSTIAKAISSELGYLFVDSGAMYRAVTLHCLRKELVTKDKFKEAEIIEAMNDITVEFKLNESIHQSEMFLNGENVEKEIREMLVSTFVSAVSAVKEVREKMVVLQRKLRGSNGVVMDGRDIGTNVFPDAELKIFMIADEAIRAKRRWNELASKGLKVSLEEIKKNITLRDYEDTHRKINPLLKAEDAIVLDNTYMTLEEQLAITMKLVNERTGV
jgi:CMP/dCMP kinase